jgi:hypothetical protein
LARQLTGLVIAGLVALLAGVQSLAAQGPSAAGLWQKIDEASGKAVVWFLFIDRGGIYEGIAAKLFQRPSDGSSHSICLRCRDDRKDASLLDCTQIGVAAQPLVGGRLGRPRRTI